MRVVFLFSLLFAVVVVWLSLSPEYATQLAQEIGESAMTALYEREVTLHGGDDALQREIFSRIKRGGSNLELRFAPEHVEKKILSIPTVQSVSIVPCSLFSLGCYVATIEQRYPFYHIHKAKNGSSVGWLSSKDGSYVTNDAVCDTCISVLGLDTMTGESSEGAQRALSKLTLFLEALKSKTACDVSRVEFLSSQELLLRVERCAQWQAVFSFPYEQSVYEKEIGRYKEVLQQFVGKESLVKRVELSYDKMAVVTLQDGVKLAEDSTQKERKVKSKKSETCLIRSTRKH